VRIGVIGAGKIGATVGALWVRAGHEVKFGSRNPQRLGELVEQLGPSASAASIEDAARWAEIVFCAFPYGIWPQMARKVAPLVAGKVVMDAANPSRQRDGAFAQAALDGGQGSGVPVADLLPRARMVRAFSSVYWETLRNEAHRAGERIAIPLAGDDPAALQTAEQLVRDAGFDPVLAGPLVQAAAFDVGAPVYNNPQTADEMERMLGLIPPG